MPKFAKRLLVAAILLLVLAAILHMGGWLQCAIFTIGAIASVFEISNAFESGTVNRLCCPLTCMLRAILRSTDFSEERPYGCSASLW